MKIFKKIGLELLLLADIGIFIALMYVWVVDRPQGIYLSSFWLIGAILTAVFAVLILRQLWRKKWRAATAKAMQKVFARIQRFFEKFADRLGFRKKGKSVISGKTTVIFDRRFEETAADRAQYTAKPPKWKQLESDRERMRYLYRKMIGGKIKKGARIYSTETPSEIEKNNKKTPAEQELFDIYIACRYDERKSPKASDVQDLKRELEIK